ncbi:MAG TPA: hypothetical protein PLS49_06000, partial [Candidatus Woesebacteria bacterium]|nr:hypothetical protein [Candidatus Woesebacteria bacterium]
TMRQFPLLQWFLKNTEEDVVLNRYKLLIVRLLTSEDVIWYLHYVTKFFSKNPEIVKKIKKIINMIQ